MRARAGALMRTARAPSRRGRSPRRCAASACQCGARALSPAPPRCCMGPCTCAARRPLCVHASAPAPTRGPCRLMHMRSACTLDVAYVRAPGLWLA